jgi:hypothetical protein
VTNAAIAHRAHLITLDPLSCFDWKSFIGSNGRKGLWIEFLRPTGGRPLRLGLQGLEQEVRGEGEEDPELIGQEPLATRPVQRQPVMQLLEPVLPRTAERPDGCVRASTEPIPPPKLWIDWE